MLVSSLGEYILCTNQFFSNVSSHIVTNPTGPIITVAEHAAAKILALGGSSGGGAGGGSGNGQTPTKQAGAVRY